MSPLNNVLIIPIHNLEISEEINGEYRIGDVLFINRNKIPRVRKKIGLPYTLNILKKKLHRAEIFNEASTFAIIKTKTQKEDLQREYKTLKETIYLLASSQHYSLSRDRKYFFGSPEFKDFIIDGYYFFDNSAKGQIFIYSGLQNKIQPYIVDKKFFSLSKHHFYGKLISIINNPKKYKLDKNWSKTLKKAGVLAGQSQFAKSLSEAFLYDMIGIEILLTKNGDKFPDAIITRLISFFGWYTNEDKKPWQNLVHRLYKIRCSLVHKGDQEDLNLRDLINADMILSNLLECLCELYKDIKSKDDILEFSNRLNAKKTLGRKITRPKIHFRRASYSKERIIEMENKFNWQWV